jgi:hypothetical protein
MDWPGIEPGPPRWSVTIYQLTRRNITKYLLLLLQICFPKFNRDFSKYNYPGRKCNPFQIGLHSINL